MVLGAGGGLRSRALIVEVAVKSAWSRAPIDYRVELDGDAPDDVLEALVRHVDAIAEIPNSIRGATDVRLGEITIGAVGRT